MKNSKWHVVILVAWMCLIYSLVVGIVERIEKKRSQARAEIPQFTNNVFKSNTDWGFDTTATNSEVFAGTIATNEITFTEDASTGFYISDISKAEAWTVALAGKSLMCLRGVPDESPTNWFVEIMEPDKVWLIINGKTNRASELVPLIAIPSQHGGVWMEFRPDATKN